MYVLGAGITARSDTPTSQTIRFHSLIGGRSGGAPAPSCPECGRRHEVVDEPTTVS